jgi:uncharacterized phage protein (TIGR02218 family)
MLTLSPAYTAHLADEVTELATCWTITRRDAVVLGFTDHPTDLTIGGIVYQAALGYSATDVSTSADLAVDNLNLQGFIDSPSITEPDLMAGVWDYAEVEIFEVITSNLTAGIRRLRRGRIGEVNDRVTLEIAGISAGASGEEAATIPQRHSTPGDCERTQRHQFHRVAG